MPKNINLAAVHSRVQCFLSSLNIHLPPNGEIVPTSCSSPMRRVARNPYFERRDTNDKMKAT